MADEYEIREVVPTPELGAEETAIAEGLVRDAALALGGPAAYDGLKLVGRHALDRWQSRGTLDGPPEWINQGEGGLRFDPDVEWDFPIDFNDYDD